MSLSKTDLDLACEVIAPAETFVIAVHTRPDADALGSALAFARGLRDKKKVATVISQDGVPETCAWLPDANAVQTTTEDREFDVGVICDCDSPDRIGENSAGVIMSAKRLMVIDHHAVREGSNYPLGHYVKDTTAAATAELVFEVLHGIRAIIDESTAELLMAGIVGDTGGFRFSNVTAQTFEFASRLVALGASPSRAAREIYENRSLKNTQLLATALTNTHYEENGRLAWSAIAYEDFLRFQAADADTESIVNGVRAVKGVEIGVLFRETEPKVVRASLRSWGNVDCNAIAGRFGGGGHKAAAGLTVEEPLEDVERAVLAEVRKWMGS